MKTISRRSFLKSTGILAGAGALSACSKGEDVTYVLSEDANLERPQITETVYWGAAGHNCGGKCLLGAYVKDGVIRRIVTDERPDFNFSDNSGKDDPQRRACLRCRSKATWYYRNDRLLYPLKQTKERGDLSGFRRITWDDAFTEISQKLTAISQLKGSDMAAEDRTYMADLGNDAGKTTLTPLCTTGDGSGLGNVMGAERLLNLFGARQPYPDNVYSYPCFDHVTRYTADNYTWGFKVGLEANSRTDYVNSDQVVMWCTNPADSVMGTNSMWYLQQTKEAGVPFVCIDSRVSRTSALLGAKHIAPIAGTDAALVMGMLCHLLDTMLFEKSLAGGSKPNDKCIINPDFIKKYVYGFFDTGNTCIVKPNKMQYIDTLWYDLYGQAFAINFPGGNIPGVGEVPPMGFGPAVGYEVPRGGSLSAYIFGNDKGLVDDGLNLATSIYPAEIGYNVRPAGHLNASDPGDELYGKKTPIYGQVKKTPEWASAITGVPVDDIKKLAEDIARKKTTILMTGAMQKSCEGEQAIWAVYALAFVTGCFGLPGQSVGTISDRNTGALLAVGGGHTQSNEILASAAAIQAKMTRNFVRKEKHTHPDLMDDKTSRLFHMMLWQDQLEYGGTGKSRWNAPEVKFGPTIKGVYMAGGNSLINQGGDTKYCMELVKKRDMLPLSVVADFYMTPSAQFADYVLPAAMAYERDSLASQWQCGENVINMPKAVDAPGEILTDVEIMQGIAAKVGKKDDIFGTKTMKEYCKEGFEGAKTTLGYQGSYEDFVKAGIISISNKNTPNNIINAYYRKSVEATIPYGLCTSTGKFEAYSQSMMEDYESRRYDNFDTIVTGKDKLATAIDNTGTSFQGMIHTKACEFKRVEDKPDTVLEAATSAETAEYETYARFVYPIPMYIPLIEGEHACDSSTTLGAYPAADANGATKHPDILNVRSTHKFLMNTYHSIKRAHSSIGNNSALVAETFKYDGNGNAAFMPNDRSANKGDGNDSLIYEKGVYEPVYIHPDDAVSLGVTKNGERLKLTSARNTSIYAAAVITKTVRKGSLVMAEGGWVCLDENGVDIGGSVNTLYSLRPSRICRGTTLGNGLRIKAEKV